MIPINIELELLTNILDNTNTGQLLSIKGIYPLLRDHFSTDIVNAYNERHNQSGFDAFLDKLKSEVNSNE